MYRGRERRCFQPLIIFGPLTSADLGEGPACVKYARGTDHDLGRLDSLDVP